MNEVTVLRNYADELERRLRLKTFPLAVKLIKSEDDIPKDAVRPLRDLGHHMLLCQAFATSRRGGGLLALLKEDMYCFEPVIGYGIAEPTKEFLEGHNRYPDDVETLEIGSRYAEDLPCLPVGKYIGVMSAPLQTTPFVPDVVLIYCDSAQLSLLLLAREYKTGYDLKQSISSHAACVYSVVPVLQNDNFRVAIPCGGDRANAMATDHELIFGIPTSKMGVLVEGLRHLAKTGKTVPRNYFMSKKPALPESYIKFARMMGMDI